MWLFILSALQPCTVYWPACPPRRWREDTSAQGGSLVPCALQRISRHYYPAPCGSAHMVSLPGALCCSQPLDLAFLAGPAPHRACHSEGFPGRASPIPGSRPACRAFQPGRIFAGDKRDILLDSRSVPALRTSPHVAHALYDRELIAGLPHSYHLSIPGLASLGEQTSGSIWRGLCLLPQ